MQPEALITIPTPAGPVRGILDAVPGAPGGVIMVGGAGGGMHGPAGVYGPLAARLQTEGVSALRLDYRRPNALVSCIKDTLAGIAFLDGQGVTSIVLIGWSFGGAVVIAAGVASPLVVGVVAVASQTFGTVDVELLAPKRLLLLHGTADQVLPLSCSTDIYCRAREPKEIIFFEGDGHGIEHHAQEMCDLLLDWSIRALAPPPDPGTP